jgi:site-specific DNA-adenine methylase
VKIINPPFNYTGGKAKLISQLSGLMDYSKENFLDLFAGGGSVT